MSAVVVDSSLYIHWLKQRVDFARLLSPWMTDGELFHCGVIRVEVLRGVISAPQRDRMDAFFQLTSEIQMTPPFWDCVLDLAWRLDRKGIIIPVPDLAIAQCALAQNATLVSLDERFRHVPGLKHQKNLPPYH